MCGIVAATALRGVNEILLSGLKTLEYRGYDSAGIALSATDRIPVGLGVGRGVAFREL